MRHHATYEKFGGDRSLITSYDHWSVLVRPKQATLGAMLVVAHSDVTSVSALPDAAFTEQARVLRDVEAALAATFAPHRINYLTLMMVDPQVHTHVLPRYERPPTFEGEERPDEAWPGPPDLSGDAGDVSSTVRAALTKAWTRR